jgi:hypothetical protein
MSNVHSELRIASQIGDGTGLKESESNPTESRSKNFRMNVISGATSKLAEQLAGAKLVIPWLLAGIGAPPSVVGLLVPIRQAGALLPQLAVSGRIRSVAVRKWFWVGAAGVQIGALLMVCATGLFDMTPVLGAVLVLSALTIYSICRGIGSIAFQDVVAKTTPKGARGILLAYRSAIGGALTIAAG